MSCPNRSYFFYLKGNEVNEITCTCSNHVLDFFKWNDESEDEVKNNILLDTQKFVDVLQIIDENTGIGQSVESLNRLLTYIFEQFTMLNVKSNEFCDLCEQEPKRQYKTLEKRGLRKNVKGCIKTIYVHLEVSIDSILARIELT